MIFLKVTFWLLVILLVYPYLVYPALLKLLIKLGFRGGKLSENIADLPHVTFIISAYNEEAVIDAKLCNTMEIDYPADKFEVIVISDACDDRTDEIVKEWAEKDARVRLVRQNERRGKTAGLNKGVAAASGDFIVFSDANAMYKRDAVRELVKYFATPEVGYVMGAALYNAIDNTAGDTSAESAESEGLYWQFELMLKKLESEFYSVVGGDGAIYAIRRELFFELRDDDINDFVNPLQIVAKGYRGIFNPQAICYEDTAEDFGKEFKRKRRIANRSWRAVKRTIGWYQFPRDAKFLWELVSHKVIRWFSMPMIIVLFGVTLFLALFTQNAFYEIALAGQIYLFAAAFLGAYLDKKQLVIPKIIYLPYYFYFVYYAAMLGMWDEKKGIKHAVWNHVRDAETPNNQSGSSETSIQSTTCDTGKNVTQN